MLPASVDGADMNILIDSGASRDFMDPELARGLSLNIQPRKPPISVALADGTKLISSQQAVDVPVSVYGVTFPRTFDLLSMKGLSAVFGRPWLTDYNPDINWKTSTLSVIIDNRRYSFHQAGYASSTPVDTVMATHDDMCDAQDSGDQLFTAHVVPAAAAEAWRAPYTHAMMLIVNAPPHTNIGVENILLTRGHRHGWWFPGGMLQTGESPWQAAVRRVKQSTDIDIDAHAHTMRHLHDYTPNDSSMPAGTRCACFAVELTPESVHGIQLPQHASWQTYLKILSACVGDDPSLLVRFDTFPPPFAQYFTDRWQAVHPPGSAPNDWSAPADNTTPAHRHAPAGVLPPGDPLDSVDERTNTIMDAHIYAVVNNIIGSFPIHNTQQYADDIMFLNNMNLNAPPPHPHDYEVIELDNGMVAVVRPVELSDIADAVEGEDGANNIDPDDDDEEDDDDEDDDDDGDNHDDDNHDDGSDDDDEPPGLSHSDTEDEDDDARPDNDDDDTDDDSDDDDDQHSSLSSSDVMAAARTPNDTNKSAENVNDCRARTRTMFNELFKPDALLTPQLHEQLADIVAKHHRIFLPPPSGLPPRRITDEGTIVEHKITEREGARPPCRPPIRLSPRELKELKEQLDDLLQKGCIRTSGSPYGAPVLFAPKKDGDLRLCTDYRQLNDNTVKDKYPLPRDTDLFDQFAGADFFTSLDALHFFWQIPMEESSIRKTAIRTPMGSFEWLVMPFGLTNAPSTAQRFIEQVLRPLLLIKVMVFIDDICVYTKGTAADHLNDIEEVLQLLERHSVALKMKKCEFFKKQINFLGHVVSGTSLRPDDEKVAAIRDWPNLTSNQEVQQFIGLINYYHKMIKDYAEKAAPLTDIMAKPWGPNERDEFWGEAQDKSFATLKIALTTDPVLALPDMDQPFIVQTDASLRAIGAVLMQQRGDNRAVIAYHSRKFTPVEQRWPTHERELFGFVAAAKKWRHYLHGNKVSFEGDHKPLVWLKTQKHLTSKQARWLEVLEELDYTITYVPGKKLTVPDAVSRRPDFMRATSMLTYLLHTAHEDMLHTAVAQPYLPLAIAQSAVESGFTIEDAAALPATTELHEYLTFAGDIDDTPDDAPDNADDEVLQIQPHKDVVNIPVTSALAPVDNNSTAIADVVKLHDLARSVNIAYHKDELAQRMMRGDEVDKKFSIHRGLIFRKDEGDEFPVLYIPAAARDITHSVITEMHSSDLAGHLSANKTLERCQRYFFWPHMRNDIDTFIKTCDSCARAKRRTTAQANVPVPFPIPDYCWEVMALDMKTGMTPTPRGMNAYWVMIDKLSRQGHAVACKKDCTAMDVARMVFDNVIRLHGIPRVIISDRDPRFTGHLWRELWKLIGTTLNMSTSHHAATDGGSERYIGTLSGMIRSLARHNAEDWDLYLSAAEFAYNDSVHPATGFTPFQLANGRDPATPMQLLLHGAVQKPVLYATNEHRIDATAFLQRFTDNLTLAKQHLRTNQRLQWQELMHRHSSPIKFEPDDWVYVENPKLLGSHIHTQEDRFLGPYRIVRKVGPNTVELDYGPYSHKHPVMNVSKLRPYRDPASYLPYPQPVQPDLGRLPSSANGAPPLALPAPPTSADAQAQHDDPEVGKELQTHPLNPPQDHRRQPTQHQRACNACRSNKVGLAQCILKGHTPVTLPGPARKQSRHLRTPPPRTIEVKAVRVVPRGLNTEEVHQGEVQATSTGEPWTTVQQAVSQGLWASLCRYLSSAPSRPSPVFTLVRRTHDTVSTNGIVAEYEPHDREYPYFIVYEDGDEEDLSQEEMDAAAAAYQQIQPAALFTALQRRPLRMLELCCGTKSVSDAVKKVFPNAKIITLDHDPVMHPTHEADVTQWDPAAHGYLPGYFDFVWASPPCTEYSIAKTVGVRNLPLADRTVKAVLNIIDFLQPRHWIIENPVGLLRLRPFMQNLDGNRVTTTYCHFGFPYRKATDLWTNIPVELPRCPLQPCAEFQRFGHHTHTAQRGSTGTAPGTGSREVAYRVPAALVYQLMKAMIANTKAK